MIDLRGCLLSSLLLAAVGCGGSSSGGGGSGSTAAGSTGGTTNTLPPIPAAPANTPGVTGLEVFNSSFQHAWDRLVPDLIGMLQTQAQALGGSVYSSGAIDVEIINLVATNSQMANAPGMTTFSNNLIVLRIPQNGTWELVIEGDVRVTLTIAGFAIPYDIPLKITVANLSMEVDVEFDHSDPTRPVLSRVGTPQIQFNARIDSTSSLLGQITPILTPLADYFAHQALNNAMGGMLPMLANLQGMPGPIPGAGAPPLADSGTPMAFAEIIANIDTKFRRDNSPHGMILSAIMDTPATDSWETAYSNGGPGNVGTVLHWGSGGDSAIFTGQYLASQAFRYSVTNDPDALANVKHALKGIGKLLDVNGASGLLARNAAPLGSIVEQRMGDRFRTTVIDGVTWVGRQGTKGISRDQYSGVFFGLSIAYELVDDQVVRTKCARRLEMMLDYLVGNDWVVTEDRGPIGTGPGSGSRGPTFWAGIANQKLTFLLMGHRFNPTKYAAEISAQGPLAENSWFGAWTGTFGVDHYYKFNLSHLAYYNYFRLETDQVRWQGFERAYRIIRRFVGHHRNAHFDLIATSVDPSEVPVLHPQTREVMRQFLRRNHREVAPAVVDLSQVVWVPTTTSSYANGTGTVTFSTTTTLMPSEPLDIELRRYTGHFHWQRDPFSPATPNAGNPFYEKHGLDAVLPYWMGRFQGAF
jgi:hypothetical protein